jgi:hypothetical protein
MSASSPALAPGSSPAGDKSGPPRPPSAGSGTTAVEPVQPSTFPAADADALDTLPESEKPQPVSRPSWEGRALGERLAGPRMASWSQSAGRRRQARSRECMLTAVLSTRSSRRSMLSICWLRTIRGSGVTGERTRCWRKWPLSDRRRALVARARDSGIETNAVRARRVIAYAAMGGTITANM